MQNYPGIFYRNWKKPTSLSERIKFTIEHIYDLRMNTNDSRIQGLSEVLTGK